ncbi:DUF5317 domain-containing protein [Bacillus pinisoli]|uniref:DUF5317 domain-containing protein n=1 Tax=Bacillus pinisoli TaxID=2901866 RepID=UPI001FF626FB|nr:DUF5317 domain-containing protein [Bacillus pinisoli]
MFIDSIIIGIIIALIMGGSFQGLVNISLKHPWLIVVAFVLQFLSIYIFPNQLLLAIIVSNTVLIAFSIFNIKFAGFKYMIIGILLNLLVMVVNGGRMPVDVEAAKVISPSDVPALLAGEYGKHVALSENTHLNFLGDIFFLQYPYPRQIVISLGDIIFSLGVILFLHHVMVKGKKKPKEVVRVGA